MSFTRATLITRQPFLRSTFSHQVVTYDDPDSLQLKAEFAFKAGLCGVSIFDAHGDTSDSQLLDGIRRGLGIIKS
jgi:chitinase